MTNSANSLLAQILTDMKNITGNQEYEKFAKEQNLEFWAKDSQAIAWVNVIAQGLPKNISTGMQLKHQGANFVSNGVCKFEGDCFNIQCDFMFDEKKKGVYQKLKRGTNSKKIVKLCDQFLSQAWKEGGNFNQCLNGKPYFQI